jgi:hypothetical protein
VYVAGGEYGTGGSLAEVYNPLTNSWTMAPSPGSDMADGNSKMLPDGSVLEALFNAGGGEDTFIYDPKTNTWSGGIVCLGIEDEASWVTLPDSSIIFIDENTLNSERYIPSLNQWIVDGMVPDSIYDQYEGESGAGFLLPDGRAFIMGATGHTAYYTPSGNINPGTWAAGPNLPMVGGIQYTPTDAAAAMMVNGKILCAFSPINTGTTSSTSYLSPTAFFEFNYLTNSFTQVTAPGGGNTLNIPCFETNMLDLPDGTVLYASQYTSQYYVYKPSGLQLAAGQPTIGTIAQMDCDTFRITGTLFNGISEGAAYGDDWQMATNYPVIRLTNGTKVYYARTYNWNRTGVVQTGSATDTTMFSISSTLPYGTYSLVVTANGISSNPVSFINSACVMGIKTNERLTDISVYPNPNDGNFVIETNSTIKQTAQVYDVNGKLVLTQTINGKTSIDASSLNEGVYNISITSNEGVINKRLVIVK